MMKIIENMFFRNTDSHKASLPGPQKNSTCINSLNEKGKMKTRNINDDYEEVKTSIDKNDWSTLNFMQWFVTEKEDENLPKAQNSDGLKIAGDGKTNSEALYSLDKDPANTDESERHEQDLRKKNS